MISLKVWEHAMSSHLETSFDEYKIIILLGKTGILGGAEPIKLEKYS